MERPLQSSIARRSRRRLGLAVVLLLGLVSVVARGATPLAAQEADEDGFPDFRPGLVGQYRDAAGTTIARLDEDVQFVWHDRRPDTRMTQGDFSAQWKGRLFTIVPGQYRLYIYAAGEVQVKLAGKVLLEKTSSEPAWLQAEPVALGYGHHPLEINYRKTNAQARIGVYWNGPKFQLEPVPQWHLFHEPKDTPDGKFELGQQLTQALRCDACHAQPAEESSLPAPALTHLKGNISAQWLIDWIQGKDQGPTAAGDETISRRMPHFDFTAQQAADIAAYLLSASKTSPAPKSLEIPPPKKNPRKNEPKPRLEPDRRAGEQLARSIGCLACHSMGPLGSHRLLGGGDLTQIADKRPTDFFARWLDDPARINADHHMPVFELSRLERADLVTYLSTLHGKSNQEAGGSNGDAGAPPGETSIERGRQLVEENRCAACHRLPDKGESAKPVAVRFTSQTPWLESCLGKAVAATHRPGYSLSPLQREAVISYLLAVKPAAAGAEEEMDGHFELVEHNCLACHARGLSPGIAAHLDAVVQADQELAPLLAALSPPALIGVGDKLTIEGLQAALSLKNPPLRPWLKIRMPRFDLSDEEMRAFTDYLVEKDGIPGLPAGETQNQQVDEVTRNLAGRRLVTADGFGCTSCHQIGQSKPQDVALAAQGSDLSMLGRRIRRLWFDRWVANPSRIVPRMEMPAIQLPIRGVLDENLPEQLAAVWHVLNEPGFSPPQPNPVRVVRRRNLPDVQERAVAMTDIVEVGPRVFLRPMLVALPNRHNVLFDLETARLAAWWTGDAGLQRTRGKSWYWEAGGTPLLPIDTNDDKAPSDMLLDVGGSTRAPLNPAQFVAELDWFEHMRDAIRFGYRLWFDAGEDDAPKRVLSVQQTFTPLGGRGAGEAPSGFRRRIEIAGLRSAESIRLLAMPGESIAISSDGSSAVLEGTPGEPRAEVVAPKGLRFREGAPPWLVLKTGAEANTAWCELQYTVRLPVDQFPVEDPELPTSQALVLEVVPGYEAIRLPLPITDMPTALAWRRDGTLVFGSLKGRVLQAHDADGDGLEDKMVVFSDGLATPYGVATTVDAQGRETIDVSAKYALLRMSDNDGDGHADRTDVVASGWGYSTDYHDWTIGLPRDNEGNYYVGLPCQQDQRSPQAAQLRGTVVRLVERKPTPDDPRLFSIEPVCAGVRFPTGLAMNRQGDWFVTDNQGNYNPFNELNHIVQGARYGFINKLDVKPDFNPPFLPPAINLPHPLTRSINGICFLHTPPAVARQLGGNLFGPFEGHLIGCEWNHKHLYRMSLQKVDDRYQGGLYPFSTVPKEGGETFEGPIVCAVAPDGDLYVGNLLDSGWGGANNTGSIVRLRPHGELPTGIAEVRARPDGFVIDFTAPVDSQLARQTGAYSIVAYRRVSTPAYGGPDIDRHTVDVEQVKVSSDGRQVTLQIDDLKEGFLYEFHLDPLAGPSQLFHPAEAYFTLHKIPAR